MNPSAPPVEQIIETAIYVEDLEATERFYHDLLGLPVIDKEAGRHIFFQAGLSSVLLAFIPDTTIKGHHLPAHGAKGPSHFAIGIATNQLDTWRTYLVASSVPIETEITWPKGGHSIYFRDPAGNSVELITRGVWSLPSGW